MRKLLALILALLMLASTLISCGNTEDLGGETQNSLGSGSGTNIQTDISTGASNQKNTQKATEKSTEKATEKATEKSTEKATEKATSSESSSDKETSGNTENGDNSKSLRYLVNIDGTTCTITGGSGDNLSIPSKIDGFTVTAIGDRAFEGNWSIKSVTIPDSVKSIGENAFSSCVNIRSVTLGSDVESIGESAFGDCIFLASIVIPNSTKTIGDGAFYNSGLTSITLGSGITSIGSSAFSGCYNLVEVINKSSCTITAGSDSSGDIAKYALEVHNGESKIKKVNDYIFYTTGGVNYLCGYVGTSKELVLPDKYNNQNYKIYKYAFYYSNMRSIVISSGVVGIGANAFSRCGSLTSAEFKTTSGWSVGGTAAGANVIANKSTVATYLKDTYKDKEWTRI